MSAPLPPRALLPGHGWRLDQSGRRIYDPGTRSPAGWCEADLVRAVAVAALGARPGSVLVSEGSYQERGQAAARLVPGAPVIQIHADAVEAEEGPDRATCWVWPGNSRARALAERIAWEVGLVVPWPVAIKEASASIDWHQGARSCLAAVEQDSVLCEVGYADGREGRVLLPRLAHDIGVALARA